MQTSSLSASVPAVRRPPSTKAPLVELDLAQPGERSVHDFLLRSTSGSTPLFRVLGLRRQGDKLLVAVESCQGSDFVLTLSLVRPRLTVRQYMSYREAMEAIGIVPSDRPVVIRYGRVPRVGGGR